MLPDSKLRYLVNLRGDAGPRKEQPSVVVKLDQIRSNSIKRGSEEGGSEEGGREGGKGYLPLSSEGVAFLFRELILERDSCLTI